MVRDVQSVFKASDRSYFAILKKDIHAIAVEAGLSGKRLHEVDIVVAELATNLANHAMDGQLLVKKVNYNGVAGIEILTIDQGPGMSDIGKSRTDGISSRNTLGLGMGSIKRLSEIFQIYSIKDWGTVMLVRIFDTPEPAEAKKNHEIRSIVIPKPGEEACGDGFYFNHTKDHLRFFLGDGLGHGPEAQDVVMKAGEAFKLSRETDPSAILRNVNEHVRKTRGLVGTAAVFSLNEKKWQICGIGNILTKINGPTYSKNYLSYNGIIGLNVPKTLNVQELEYEKGQHLIMCSDGLKSRWETLKFPNILRYDMSVLAAVLVREYNRNTDDTSVGTVKLNF